MNLTPEQISILIKCFKALDDTITLEDMAEGFDVSVEELIELRETIEKE